MHANNHLTDEEYNRLVACRSDEEWSAACDAVKAARKGRYPDDWYARIIQSGVLATVVRGFGGDPEIKVLAPNVKVYPDGI